MINSERKEVVNSEIVEVSVTCNNCGKTYEFEGDYDTDNYERNKFSSFRIYFGYGSRFDDDRWSFELCENCMEEMARSFKIKPDGFFE